MMPQWRQLLHKLVTGHGKKKGKTRKLFHPTLEEARERIEAWRQQYNEERPHRALGGKTPREFLAERGRACPAPLG
jgi:transposase InsO family protein